MFPCLVLLTAASVSAAEEKKPDASEAVAARLNGEPILASDAGTEFRLAYGDRQFTEPQRQRLMRAALEQVIDRRLVMDYLRKSGQAAGKDDVDLALAQFEKELKAQNLTLAQHCEKVGLTIDGLRRSLAWKLSWKRYCEKYLTAANLERYFDRNRREFDGTQLRVAQILFKLAAEADDATVSAAKDRAARLRQEITAGTISFSDAAKRNSEAPSKDAGGDIGWIERHRPMPEDFSRAAFALKKSEVGEPFLSSFGVHLITVIDEKPGTRTWRETENELRPAVTLYLFRWIADKERSAAKIEYKDE